MFGTKCEDRLNVDAEDVAPVIGALGALDRDDPVGIGFAFVFNGSKSSNSKLVFESKLIKFGVFGVS